MWLMWPMCMILDYPRRSGGGCYGASIWMIAPLIYMLWVLLGGIFGIIGAIKNEKPRWYYIIGLLCNWGWFIWMGWVLY